MAVAAGWRYILALGPNGLERWDRLTRSSKSLALGTNEQVLWGIDGHFLHLVHDGATLHAGVRHVRKPSHSIATAAYDDGWSFTGPASAWAMVPEYVVLNASSGAPAMVRIADGAEIDRLEDFQFTRSVSLIPGSRLVVLAGGGYVSAYDPIGRRAGAHLRLEEQTQNPVVGFDSDGKTMLVNDGGTLIKLETVDWTVVDAAGSDDEQRSVIAGWTREAGSVLVWRESREDVLQLNVATLLPEAAVTFPRPPVDAVVVGKSAIGIDAQGKWMSKRLADLA